MQTEPRDERNEPSSAENGAGAHASSARSPEDDRWRRQWPLLALLALLATSGCLSEWHPSLAGQRPAADAATVEDAADADAAGPDSSPQADGTVADLADAAVADLADTAGDLPTLACSTGQACAPVWPPTCPGGSRCHSRHRVCQLERCAAASDPCDDDLVCQQGLICNRTADRCERPGLGGQGAPCSDDRACLPELACDLRAVLPVCAPPGPVGGACLLDADCGAGLDCDGPEEDGLVCLGPGRSGRGQPCRSNRECAADLVCDLAGEPPVCLAPATLAEGAGCWQDEVCGAGLRCIRQACRRLAGAGEVCEESDLCAAGLICSLAGAPHRCVVDRPLVEGAACSTSPPFCEEGLLCDPLDWRCRPRLPEGADCSTPASIGRPCAAGLDCNWTEVPPTCRLLGSVAAGQLCSASGLCEAGLACSRFTDECGPPAGPGDLCTVTDECAAGLSCRSRGDEGYVLRCDLPGSAARLESCQSDRDCAEGLICLPEAPRVEGGRCMEPGGRGDYCVLDSQCAPGWICLGAEPHRHGGSCALPGAALAPCLADTDCGPALLCDQLGRCAAAGQGGAGAVCLDDRFCGAAPAPLRDAHLSCLADAAGIGHCTLGGEQADGEGCQVDGDCQPGLTCTRQRCVAPAGPGQPCEDGRACAAGLRCGWEQGGPVCTPLGAAGDACAGAGCAPGLACRILPQGPGTCVVPGEEGAACGDSEDCAPELACNQVEGDGRCRRARSLEVGQPCSDPLFCRPGLTCPGGTRSARCRPLHQGRQADPCVSHPVDDSCAPGLVCRHQRCDLPGEPGEVCDLADLDCRPGLTCVMGDRCTAGGLTEPCWLDGDCQPGNVCEGNRCQAAAASGEVCSDDPDCQPGLRCLGGDQPRRCAAAGATGLAGPCSADLDCAAGLACVAGPPGARRCGPTGGEGDPCARSAACGEAAPLCVASEPASRTPGSCRTTGAIGPGGRCDSPDAQLLQEACRPDLVCRRRNELARCTPPATLHETCDLPAQCVGGLTCRQGQCQPPAAEGEECAEDQQCAAGLRCAGSYTSHYPGHCAAGVGVLGGPCGPDGACAAGTYCDALNGAVCRTPAAEGQPCTQHWMCQAGLRCSAAFAACFDPR